MAATAEPLTFDSINITDVDDYVTNGYPWAAWDLLRREAPVHWYERPGFEPFWALTKYEDIGWVSRNPQLFSNAQRLRISDVESNEIGERGREINAARYGGSPDDPPDFIFTDPPEHRKKRSMLAGKFTPKAMRALEGHFDELGKRYVGDFARVLIEKLPEGDEVDLVHELATTLPLAAICEMADVPREDWEKIFHWTEVAGGANDPDFQIPEKGREGTIRAMNDARDEYMLWLIEQRAQDESPSDDLITILLRAEIDGQRLTRREVLNYINVLIAAGNVTTRNSISGGVQALLEHPDEKQKLIDDPSLVESAVEEMLRWTSIVVQFSRTCVEDTEIRGQQIRKGETVALWYPSANRDEDVFEDPYTFDISRDPNPHFAFGGYGEHFCLGANLARWEMRTVFRELIPILPNLELAGKAKWVRGSIHVGGIKYLPVRYRKG